MLLPTRYGLVEGLGCYQKVWTANSGISWGRGNHRRLLHDITEQHRNQFWCRCNAFIGTGQSGATRLEDSKVS